jgi:molecular chaperone GrpE
MTDSRRTPQQRSHEHRHSDEHRQAHSSPGADAPGEEKPRTASSRAAAAPADEESARENRAASGGADTDGTLEPAPCDGDFNGDGADVQGDLDELVKTAAQRDEYLALAQRTQADFENYRKRVARESASASARGAIMLAKELLPALDNLDRALEAAAKDDPLLDGVRIVRSELSAALARTGIESFSPAGEAFDPEVHEAVATSEQPADGAASGTVVEVYQLGYRCGETIIRAARVVVAA